MPRNPRLVSGEALQNPLKRTMEKREPMMQVESSFFLLLACFAVGIAYISGCSSHRSHLVKVEDLFVETIPSSRVYISDITARQEGDELMISGKVSRRNTPFSGAGHVDIAVISPGGLVIETANVPYTPKILPKTPGARKHRTSRFEARLRCIPPAWTVIRVAYHARAASGDPMPDHENNIALPEDHDYGG